MRAFSNCLHYRSDLMHHGISLCQSIFIKFVSNDSKIIIIHKLACLSLAINLF